MSKKKKKCPSCGLANFREAAQCQWCALVLRGRARNELVDDLPRPGGVPWGPLLLVFALLVVGGGVIRHLKLKADERAALAAETAETDEPAAATAAKRTGLPKLSGRSPSDPPDRAVELMAETSIVLHHENQARRANFHQRTQEYMRQVQPRDVFGRPLLPNGDVAPLPLPGEKPLPPREPDDDDPR